MESKLIIEDIFQQKHPTSLLLRVVFSPEKQRGIPRNFSIKYQRHQDGITAVKLTSAPAAASVLVDKAENSNFHIHFKT